MSFDNLITSIRARDTNTALNIIANREFNLGQTDNAGDTALMNACWNELPEVVTALIATGESAPDLVDEYGNTALMAACEFGLSEVALTILNTGKSNPDEIDDQGNTALIKTGDARIDHLDYGNHRALMRACQNGMTRVTLALIASGQSNPAQISDDGDTALILACYNKMM